MVFVAEREIEVFGEAVGLEIAFFQAGSALEDPRFRKRGMRIDPCENPAENIIFLDDGGAGTEAGC